MIPSRCFSLPEFCFSRLLPNQSAFLLFHSYLSILFLDKSSIYVTNCKPSRWYLLVLDSFVRLLILFFASRRHSCTIRIFLLLAFVFFGWSRIPDSQVFARPILVFSLCLFSPNMVGFSVFSTIRQNLSSRSLCPQRVSGSSRVYAPFEQEFLWLESRISLSP